MDTGSIPVLRTSERAAFKRCPQRWWWEYREGWKPRGQQADALWFGIGIHQALAEWYLKGKRRGPHPADTWREWTADEIRYARTYLDDTFDEPVWMDARELGTAMLEEYVDHYGKDPQWSIIAIEQEFAVKINFRGEVVAIFASRWDGVLRDLSTGKLFLLENKTASQIVTAYLELDDQGGSYLAVAEAVLRAKGILKANEHIEGIIYNFLRKAAPDERPVNAEGLRLNKDLTVSKKQPPPLFRREVIYRSVAEQATQLERIADEVAVMNAVRSGSIPITKTPTKDCPRCPFWGVCVLHERNKTAYRTVLKANYVQADPYKDMRKSA